MNIGYFWIDLPFEGETFWVPMLIGFEFMKMPAKWTFSGCQYGLDFGFGDANRDWTLIL
jgi:hypothetical protein